VILLATFMALEQLDLAQDIVLVFFIAVVGAAALAAGIAFGFGGREVAAEIVREWYTRGRPDAQRRGTPQSEKAPPAPSPSADARATVEAGTPAADN
jgi:hypothetical protein